MSSSSVRPCIEQLELRLLLNSDIYGTVWEDLNADGLRTLDEPGLADITVFLDLNDNGTADVGEPTTLTADDDPVTTGVDETGQYSFTKLPTGTHVVRQVLPAYLSQTFPMSTDWASAAETILTASDAIEGQYYGRSVSIYEDFVVVGAPAVNSSTDSDAAYVCTRNGETWSEVAKLLPSDAYEAAHFGSSVSMWGDTIVVGAPYDETQGWGTGAAFVYRWDGTSWAEEQKILASDAGQDEFFGWSVSIHGDTMIVGAPRLYTGSKAYIYRRDGTTWTEEALLQGSTIWFGYSVGIWDDVAVVGSEEDGEAAFNAGAAHVYRWNGAGWAEEAKLMASDAAASDRLGGSMAIWDDLIVVGADAKDNKAGAAYAYRWDGSSWNNEFKFMSPNPDLRGYFGTSVSIWEDTVLIGAPETSGTESISGAAYVYDWEGSAWSNPTKLSASNEIFYEWFGGAVDLWNDEAIVGAFRNAHAGPLTGAAYIKTPPVGPDAHRFTLIGHQIVTDADFGNTRLPSPTPDAPDLIASDDTGASDSDNLTNRNNADPGSTLSFLVGNTISGATVELLVDSLPIGSAVASGTTTTVTTDGSTLLADGPRTFTARQTIPGYSPSPESAALEVTIDIAPPNVTVAGVSTPDPSPQLTGGVDDAAATVTVTLDGSSYPATNLGNGTWVVSQGTVGPLDFGIYDVAATSTDTAGNVGTDATADELEVVVPAPTAPDLVAADDSGASGSDNLTNRNNADAGSTLSFLVGSTISGATVELLVDSVPIGSAVASGTTTTVTTDGSTLLADGPRAFTARQTMPGYSPSPESAVLEVTIDTVPPNVTVDPLLTSDQSPQLTGGVDDPAATVTVTLDGSSYPATNLGNGTWVVSQGTVGGVDFGIYDVAATATDMAGNVGTDATADELEVIVPAPAAPNLVAADDSGASDSDNLTNRNNADPGSTLSFLVGSTISGATVELLVDGVPMVSAVASGTTTTVTTDGITVLADGVHTFAARQTVPDYLPSVESAALEVTIDITPPNVTVAGVSTPDPSPQLTGGVDDAAATVTVLLDGSDYPATNMGDGTWAISQGTVGPLDVGIYDAAATATDLAGNVGTDGTVDEIIVLDVVAPTLEPPGWSAGHAIDDSFGVADCVHAADVDGDGDLDVLGAGQTDDAIAWWENDGSGDGWTQHMVDDGFAGAMSVYAGDIDGDGDMDVLGSAFDDDVTWWENDGSGGGWARHTIDSDSEEVRAVHAADIDGDGDLDVLGAMWGAGDIIWWENDGTGGGWVKDTISGSFYGVSYVCAVDMDGDDDLDVLGSAYTADDIAWWENDGSGNGWARHSIEPSFYQASSVDAADVDGDGDTDILGTARGQTDDVAWWENDGSPSYWPEHTIDGNFDGARSVCAADLNGDRAPDVLAAASHANDVTCWINDGTGGGWTEHTIDGEFNYAMSVCAADLDGDGDLDVLGAAWYDYYDIMWWANGVPVQVEGTLSVLVRFTEAMGSGVLDPNNYTVSGSGAGTLSVHPDSVEAVTDSVYRLIWTGGEMLEGGDVTIEVAGVTDVAGNTIDTPNSGTAVGGGFGVMPTVTAVDPAADAVVPAGDLDVLVTFSEPMQGFDPADVVLAGGATGGAWVDMVEAITPEQWRVVLRGLTDGLITMTLAPDPNDVEDLVGHDLTPTTWDYVVDSNLPVVSGVSVWDYVAVAVTFSEEVAVGATDPGNYTLSGSGRGTLSVHPDSVVQQGTDVYELNWHAGEMLDGGDITVTVSGVEDLAGNPVASPNSATAVGAAIGIAPTMELPGWSSARWIYGLYSRDCQAADIDGDGDLDVIGTAGLQNVGIAWYANNGSGGGWTKHTIDDYLGLYPLVYPADIDGDGDLDVIGAVGFRNDTVAWYTNDGAGGGWAEHTIDGDFDGTVSLYAEDLDGDGDLDVLAAASSTDDITWWANDGAGGGWAEHTIDGDFDGAWSVRAADLDGDGDPDVLTAAYLANDITWWANDGAGGGWAEHTIDGDFDGARSVCAEDMDGDGDMDVIGAAFYANDVNWWENDGVGGGWIEHTIGDDVPYADLAHVADMDGDGDMDVVGVRYGIVWWANDGAGGGWAEHMIDPLAVEISSIDLADLDGDSDPDVVVGSGYGVGLSWREHRVPVWVDDALSVIVNFTEPMGAGTLDPSNYTVSGSGIGTLAPHPDSVTALSGGAAYRLTWLAGEMFDGGDITITAADVADAVGNPMGAPNSGTNVGRAIGFAPTVTAVEINRGANQCSRIMELAFAFSEDVSATMDPGDLTLYDQTHGVPVNTSAAKVSHDVGTNTATWDLSAVTLLDAYYQATLSAAGIADPAGNPLDGDGDGAGGDDLTHQFFRLAGDANGDATVNVGDLGILGTNYGTTGNWWELLADLNADGDVNVGDLGILGAGYGNSLTAPGGGSGSGVMGISASGYSSPTGEGGNRQEALVDVLRPGNGLAFWRSQPGDNTASVRPGPAPRALSLPESSTGAFTAKAKTTISDDRTPDRRNEGGLVDVLGLSRLSSPLRD